jgi:hypothetical protein
MPTGKSRMATSMRHTLPKFSSARLRSFRSTALSITTNAQQMAARHRPNKPLTESSPQRCRCSHPLPGTCHPFRHNMLRPRIGRLISGHSRVGADGEVLPPVPRSNTSSEVGGARALFPRITTSFCIRASVRICRHCAHLFLPRRGGDTVLPYPDCFVANCGSLRQNWCFSNDPCEFWRCHNTPTLFWMRPRVSTMLPRSNMEFRVQSKFSAVLKHFTDLRNPFIKP